jgi:hypothetical protein
MEPVPGRRCTNGMKRLTLAALALVAAFAAAQPGAAKNTGVLAVVGLDTQARLGYVDPATLKLVGRSTQVGYYTGPSARSPDGTRLALARSYLRDGLRIVDLKRMRTIKAFQLAAGFPDGLAWVAPRKILVAENGLSVVAVDPTTGKQLWRRSVPASYDRVARSAGGFVLISAPHDYEHAVGATTLSTVGATGVVRSVVLDRILTGAREPDESNPAGAQRRAGLAVDVGGNRAFVVGAGEPVAEIDLGSLAVTYHGGTRTLSKLLDGPYREATWLPNGTIAVTGYDGHVATDTNGIIGESQTPAGLTIVDARDWSSRLVDPSTDSVVLAGDLLLAYSWFQGAGLGVFSLDGSTRLHALAGPIQSVQVGAGMAFATMQNGTGWKLAVLDLATGRVVSTKPSANILLVP